MSQPKILVISYSFPPYVTPSAVLVNNIFKEYKGAIQAIGGSNFSKVDSTFAPPCETHYIKHPQGRLFESILYRTHYMLMPYYYKRIKQWVQKHKPDVIFGNYPKDAMLVASYRVAKEFGIPFYVYMHDLWEENMSISGSKKFAQKWEPEILEKSDRVICCTEKAQTYYKKKYGINSNLILHAVPDKDIDEFVEIKDEKDKSEKIVIVFSGSLAVHMNRDAFAVMSQAMDLLPENYELLWLPITKIDQDTLKEAGISSSKIRQKLVNRMEMKEELRKANIVFAPLSHKNASMDEVMTVFSNKLLSYLVSGTPILVFGPKGCYHNELALSGKWGYVVDEDSPQTLANAILEMASPNFDRNSLVNNALEEANRRRASKCANTIENWVRKDVQKF
ncbi:MAG: glycosyltransferase [Bacteroidetes bacterium]|nr:glycosyltransferase [Bacteroidota bacterium]